MLRFLLGLIITILIVFGWQNMVRALAKRGQIWVLVPEMTALAIMRDRALDFILVICSDKVWNEIKLCCDIKNENERNPQSALSRWFGFGRTEIEGNKIIRLRKGLYFIGVPWIYQVYEWFLTESDKLAAKKALHSLTLSIMNIVYEPQKIDPLNGVINLLTADGVEVQAKITYYLTIRHPEKSLFNIEHIKTFIRDLIIPAWRGVLSEFQFFTYKEIAAADSKENYLISAMQTLNEKLKHALGIPEKKETRENFEELVKSFEGVAKILYNEGGIITEDITLSEFEPVREEVAKALENILIAKTEAQAAIQTATGQKEVDRLDGEGKKAKLDALGEDRHFVVAVEAFEKAFESLGKVNTLALMDIRGLLGPLFDQLNLGKK
jgi:hypothetical protein